MVLLTVLDVLLSVVGAVGMVYQGVCIVASLFAKPVTFPKRPWTSGTPCSSRHATRRT